VVSADGEMFIDALTGSVCRMPACTNDCVQGLGSYSEVENEVLSGALTLPSRVQSLYFAMLALLYYLSSKQELT
jgi:hypothetical protein